jgi:hypothetical protein
MWYKMYFVAFLIMLIFFCNDEMFTCWCWLFSHAFCPLVYFVRYGLSLYVSLPICYIADTFCLETFYPDTLCFQVQYSIYKQITHDRYNITQWWKIFLKSVDIWLPLWPFNENDSFQFFYVTLLMVINFLVVFCILQIWDFFNKVN